MTKVLNLDDLQSSADKVVKLGGVEHRFVPFTVGAYIDQLKEIEADETKGELSPSEYAEHLVRTVHRAFPTITEDDVKRLSVEKLTALADFVRDVAKEEASAAPEAVDAEGNVEGKST